MLLFAILVIIVSVILGLIVLVQNPKGGGLSGTFGGVGNQLMGVKQTTDVLEKGTWIFAGVVAIMCIISPAFIDKDATTGTNKNAEYLDKAPANAPAKQNTPGITPVTPATPADTGM